MGEHSLQVKVYCGFDFKNKVASSGYVIRVLFTDGTFLDISVDGGSGGGSSIAAESESLVSTDDSIVTLTTISTFPNPFRNELNVTVNIEYNAEVELKLFDMEGRLVLTFDSERVKAGSNTITLYIDDRVSEAMYMLSVNTGKEELRTKVLKER